MQKRMGLIAFGIIVILALIWWAGIDETISIVRSTNWKYLSLAILMQALAVIAWALRWRVFLNRANVRESLSRVLVAVLVGIFVNNITPGARAGGEPARMYVVSRGKDEIYGRTFATVMADRILDAIPVMLFTFVAFKYALDLKIHVILLILSISTLVLLLILGISLLFSFNERLAKGLLSRLLSLLKRVFPHKFAGVEEKIEKKFERGIMDFRKTLIDLSKDKVVFFKTLFYSLFLWVVMMLRTFFVFMSIGHPLKIYEVLMVQMAGIALGMISILPGGIGITEGVNSALYLSLSLDKGVAVTATVVDRFISFWLPTIVGGAISFYLSAKGRKA
ncbi:flippase-like domain-containing protein [Palaeococcus sp. (in: euryarchaeotes)]